MIRSSMTVSAFLPVVCLWSGLILSHICSGAQQKPPAAAQAFSCVPIYKIEHMCYIVYANTCLVL